MEDISSNIIDDSRDPVAAAWLKRTGKADEYFKNWADRFQCDKLEEYYYGFQWQDGSPTTAYQRYVINLVFSTIEIKKPSLLFNEIAFRVKPKPAKGEFDFTASAGRARNREDLLNTIFQDPEQEFADEFEAFITDAFFRFAVMEVGYSANWIENPNAGKPILKSDNNPYYDPDTDGGEDNVLKEPPEIPEEERIYFKRIPPWRFRVGGTDGSTFKKCSWVGYYDYFRAEDLKANKSLKNLDKLEFSGARSEDFNESGLEIHSSENESMLRSGDLVKVWTIFDIRAKKKYVIAASQAVTLLEKKFKKLPLVSLKFVNKLRGWYPIPLVYNWKGPQDEQNDCHEQMRLHRRRAARRYLYADGTFTDDNEIAKLESGPDMTFAKTQGNPGDRVVPLASAALDSATAQSMQVSKDDFNIISATSSEQRGQSDRTTATQANITNMQSQLRETGARIKVAKTLTQMARLALLTAQDHFSLSFWVKVRTDQNNEDFLQEFREAQEEWKELTSGELGDDEDFQVDISIDSISPIENNATKQAYIEFLSILTQFPQIAFDPILVRETAYRCNYRNEKVIARMAQMAQIAAIGQAEMAKQSLNQAMGGAMGGQSNAAQTRVAQMQPPDQNQIQTQIQGQLQ